MKTAALTEAERGTVMALLSAHDLTPTAAAAVMCVHLNTLKYRVKCISTKWGIPNRPGAVLVEAVRRGYGQSDAELVVAELLAELEATLPGGRATPLAAGIRQWLEDGARRFLRDRSREAA
ncbi:MAG TPA: hypothetical protein VIR57_00120 [Chloroflexota bacterium]|jgi:hypothetical protein